MTPVKKIVIFSDGSFIFETKAKFTVATGKNQFLFLDRVKVAGVEKTKTQSQTYPAASKRYKGKYAF